MYIKKLIERGVAVCTFLCMMAAVPAFASNICYLPSGQCGADAVKIKARYTMSSGEKLPDNGKCGVYNTQNTDSWQTPPNEMYKGEVGETANCIHSCGKDAPENCIATCKTTNNICYACDTELKYGRYAWYCKASCSSGGLVTEEEKLEMQAEGCYKFTFSNYEGNRCYEYLNLKESYSTIITNAERKAEYDDSCFTFEEKKVEGGVCYIPTPRTCKTGYYLDVVSKEGEVPEKCECKEYILAFQLKKRESKSFSSSIDLEFGPKAETKYVTIVSTLTGDQGVIDVAYSIKDSTCENIGCHTTASADGKELTIACEANLTAVEKVCNITAIQNNADIEAKNKNAISNLTIGVKVKPDTCGDYSVVDNCVGDTKAKVVEDVVSVAGQACYQCLDDKCPDGAIRETPISRDGYEVKTTDFGTECFIPKPCDEGYSTDFQGVADCGDKQHPDGWRYDFLGYSGDLRCGKCVPATCNGDGYELKCIPEPEIPCADKNSADCPWSCVGPIAAGDDVLFNCNPKACTEGDTKYQSVADCGKSGNNGWEFTEKGKSGNLICGDCRMKLCKGTVAANDKVRCVPAPICDGASDSCGYTFAEGDREWQGDDFLYNGRIKPCTGKKADGTPYDHQCENTPRCTNPSAADCGYINFKVEIEGDTPKYDSDDKPCESGYNVDTTCTGNFTYEGKGKSGEKECGKCVCNLKAEGNWTVDTATCTKVCPLTATGNWTVDSTTCTKVCPLQAKANHKIVDCEYVCDLQPKANYAIINCEYVCDLPAKEGYTIENCQYKPEPCTDGYSTEVTSCSKAEGYMLSTNGKSGNKTCGKCVEFCPIGDGNSYGQPGTWGSACTEDSQCQSSSDYSLICVNKDSNGCGVCKECGEYKGKRGKAVCQMKGIRDKGLRWMYVPAASADECDKDTSDAHKKIGKHCLVKSPTQVFSELYNSGKKPYGSFISEESKDCQNADGSCKDGCYPDFAHDQDKPYSFHRCQKPYEGEETWGCTTDGECIWKPSNADSWTCDKDGVCQLK